MRKILKIAKLELGILFYSPVAWLVLTIFMIQCGLGFLHYILELQSVISLGREVEPITGGLFGGSDGLFTTIQGNLYLYIPILTMGLMSRETSSGSIKLLLSSPVKLKEIILGKYLAIITYGFLLIVILGIYTIIGIVAVKDADVGMLLSGLLSLYLLICAYAAIGLFMSCLTTYQVVAAISTLAVFAALRFVGSLGQGIDFVRDLTFFLSISGRTGTMIAGLISTKDVFYFLIIIVSFLMLCVLLLKTQRESKPWTIRTGRYVLLIVCALMLGYLSSRPMFTGYWDVTTTKSMTLTKVSQDVAKKIEGPVVITTYANLFAMNVSYFMPEERNYDLERFEQYKRFIPGLELKYVYYYEMPVDTNDKDFELRTKGYTDEQLAGRVTTGMGIDSDMFMPPSQIHKIIDLAPEGKTHVRTVEYNGKTIWLRFFRGNDDPFPHEAEITAALKRLETTAPKIVFLTGNNERNIGKRGDRDYQLVASLRYRREALRNQGFDIDSLNLSTQDIPSDVDIVVIGDPTVSFTAQEQQKITAYISKGGNMLITGEPGRQALLNPLLNPLGIQLKTGMIVMPDKDLTPGFVDAGFSKQSMAIDTFIRQIALGEGTVAVQGAAAIDYHNTNNFNINPLLLSPKNGWNKEGDIDLTSTDISYDPAKGDQKGVFPIAVSATRKINNKEQRIVASGDADFMGNGELTRPRRGYNEFYADAIFRWFCYGAFPIEVQRPPLTDTTILISRNEITALMYVCRGIIPALIAIFGAIVLFKRRRN